MIIAWIPSEGQLRSQRISVAEQLVPEAVWLDLERPSPAEFRWIEEAYQHRLPDINDLKAIEASARFFQDDAGLHVRAYFLHEIPERPSNVTVGFVLNNERLFTLRDEALIIFQQYGRKLETQRETVTDAFGTMLELFELMVDRLADFLEELHIGLEKLNARVFHAGERDLEEVLTLLATFQDGNDKARLSLMDKQRGLSFLLRSKSWRGHLVTSWQLF